MIQIKINYRITISFTRHTSKISHHVQRSSYITTYSSRHRVASAYQNHSLSHYYRFRTKTPFRPNQPHPPAHYSKNQHHQARIQATLRPSARPQNGFPTMQNHYAPTVAVSYCSTSRPFPKSQHTHTHTHTQTDNFASNHTSERDNPCINQPSRKLGALIDLSRQSHVYTHIHTRAVMKTSSSRVSRIMGPIRRPRGGHARKRCHAGPALCPDPRGSFDSLPPYIWLLQDDLTTCQRGLFFPHIYTCARACVCVFVRLLRVCRGCSRRWPSLSTILGHFIIRKMNFSMPTGCVCMCARLLRCARVSSRRLCLRMIHDVVIFEDADRLRLLLLKRS